jgi:hypothetical protein
MFGSEPHQGECGHGLAGAGFPDDAEAPPFVQREGCPVHNALGAAVSRQVDGEVGDPQQHFSFAS